MKDTKTKGRHYYGLFWGSDAEEQVIICINCSSKKFEELTEDYKKSDPETYNIIEFVYYLENRGYDAFQVGTEEMFYF